MPRADRPRRRAALLTAGFAGLLGAGVVGALHSPVFEAGEIAVRGASHHSGEAILRLAGLHPGSNVFFLDTGEVERRLEGDPWIATATVARSLPSTVSITVLERTGVATVRTEDGYRTVSADGVELDLASSRPALPLLKVRTPRQIASAATVAGSMSSGLRGQTDVISADPSGDITVTLHSGLIVRYGDATQAEAKSQALTSLLRWSDGQGAELESADVSAPSAPTAALAGGGVVNPPA